MYTIFKYIQPLNCNNLPHIYPYNTGTTNVMGTKKHSIETDPKPKTYPGNNPGYAHCSIYSQTSLTNSKQYISNHVPTQQNGVELPLLLMTAA